MSKYLWAGLVILLILLIPYCQKDKTYTSVDLSHTSTYTELEKKLENWADDSFITSPKLQLKLNTSDQGYYKNGTISILLTKRTLHTNPSKIDVILAHEFSHHYLSSKLIEMSDPLAEELFCDFMASRLVGHEKVFKVLNNKFISTGREDSELKSRLEFLKKKY